MAENNTNMDVHQQEMEKVLTKASSASNTQLYTEEKYQKILACLHGKDVGAQMKHYVKTKKFQLQDIGGLAVKDAIVTRDEKTGNILRVIPVPKVYNAIKQAHTELNHAGYKKTMELLSRSFFGIPRSIVQTFCKDCPICQLKAKQTTRAPLKPIVEKDFLARIQVDLIDMRNRPDGEYNYICHTMDHFSKFHVLFPLKTKSAVEVAQLLEERVLAYLGSPRIFHSDNGTEFVNQVLRALLDQWGGETTFVTGLPRHFQTQGLVERGNQSVRNKIAALTAEYGSAVHHPWASWLPRIMYGMNVEVHETLKDSPYRVVYGQNPKGALFPGAEVHIVKEEDIADLPSDISMEQYTQEERNSADCDSEEYSELQNKSDSTDMDINKENTDLLMTPSTEREQNSADLEDTQAEKSITPIIQEGSKVQLAEKEADLADMDVDKRTTDMSMEQYTQEERNSADCDGQEFSESENQSDSTDMDINKENTDLLMTQSTESEQNYADLGDTQAEKSITPIIQEGSKVQIAEKEADLADMDVDKQTTDMSMEQYTQEEKNSADCDGQKFSESENKSDSTDMVINKENTDLLMTQSTEREQNYADLGDTQAEKSITRIIQKGSKFQMAEKEADLADMDVEKQTTDMSMEQYTQEEKNSADCDGEEYSESQNKSDSTDMDINKENTDLLMTQSTEREQKSADLEDTRKVETDSEVIPVIICPPGKKPPPPPSPVYVDLTGDETRKSGNIQEIRKRAHERTVLAAHSMSNFYNKRKRIQVRDFQIGDRVTVGIPKKDRAPSDFPRLPCTIVDVKGEDTKFYVLATRHGLLKGQYRSGDLMPFTGEILSVETSYLTLREAARAENPQNHFITSRCCCTTGCSTFRCTCFKNKITCSNHCHIGQTCTNNGKPCTARPTQMKPELGLGPKQVLNDLHIEAMSTHLKAISSLDGLRTPLDPGVRPDGGVAPYVQVLHVDDFHWVAISNVKEEVGVVGLYNSLNETPSKNIITKINKYLAGNTEFKLLVKNVQVQDNGYDCGVYALAFATALVFDQDPTQLTFIEPRKHLVQCLRSETVTPFPSVSIYRRPIRRQFLVRNEIMP